MNIYTPYTYLIGWIHLDKWYYGVRYKRGCNPSDLWNPYKTSSKHVHEFINKHGEPDVVQVRKIFSCSKKAHLYEQRVLTKLNVLHNERWINCGIGGTHNNPGNRSPRTQKQRETASRVLSATLKKRSKGTFAGRKHTAKTIELLSNTPLVLCPHCETQGKGNIMKRWHFDNCKFAKKIS